MLALILGAMIGGILGAILALPITAAGRDVYMHLFARLSLPGEVSGTGEASGPGYVSGPGGSGQVAEPDVDRGDGEGLEDDEHPVGQERAAGDRLPGSI